MLAYRGNAWPKPKSGLVRWAQQRLLGPSGRNAVALDWRVLMEADPGDVLTGVDHREMFMQRAAIASHLGEAGIVGDQHAKPLWPRGWRDGVGLAVLQSAVEMHQDCRPGVAYYTEDTSDGYGHWVAGMLPEGKDFGRATIDGQEYRTVIARIGRDHPVIAPVLINPHNSEVHFPFSTLAQESRTGILPEAFIAIRGVTAELAASPTFVDAPVV